MTPLNERGVEGRVLIFGELLPVACGGARPGGPGRQRPGHRSEGRSRLGLRAPCAASAGMAARPRDDADGPKLRLHVTHLAYFNSSVLPTEQPEVRARLSARTS